MLPGPGVPLPAPVAVAGVRPLARCARHTRRRRPRRPRRPSAPRRTSAPSPAADPGSPGPAAPPASPTGRYWVLRPSRGSFSRDLWSELNEDHAVAVSHHDATLTSANIEHHIRGRNPQIRRLRWGDFARTPVRVPTDARMPMHRAMEAEAAKRQGEQQCLRAAQVGAARGCLFPASGCPRPVRRSKPPSGHRLAMAFASMARQRFARDGRPSGRQVRREPVRREPKGHPPEGEAGNMIVPHIGSVGARQGRRQDGRIGVRCRRIAAGHRCGGRQQPPPPRASGLDTKMTWGLVGLGLVGHMLRSPRFYETVAVTAIAVGSLRQIGQQNRASTTARLAAWNQREMQRFERKAQRRARGVRGVARMARSGPPRGLAGSGHET